MNTIIRSLIVPLGLILFIFGLLGLWILCAVAFETPWITFPDYRYYSSLGRMGNYWNYTRVICHAVFSVTFPVGIIGSIGAILLHDSFRCPKYLFSAPVPLATGMIVFAMVGLIWPGPMPDSRSLIHFLIVATACISTLLCVVADRLFRMTPLILGVNAALFMVDKGITNNSDAFAFTVAAILITGMSLDTLLASRLLKGSTANEISENLTVSITSPAKRPYVRSVLAILIAIVSISGYLRFAERYQEGFGLSNHPSLPPTASNINYSERLNKDRRFLADFDISELEYVRYLSSLGCEANDRGKVLMSSAYGHPFNGVLFYDGGSLRYEWVTAAYDRTSHRANIEMRLKK